MDIKIKTTGGKAIHAGYSQDGGMGTYCLTGKNSTLVEMPADTELTCKHCVKHHFRQAVETVSDPIAPVESIETIRISADMETVLTHMVDVLGSAVGSHVVWGAGKLLLTKAGRRALSWFMEARAESARESLRTVRAVYPHQRDEWRATIKLSALVPE